jgi:hypothetical protein
MVNNSRLLRMFAISWFLFGLAGCSHPKILYDKPGLTSEEFNRDRYDCVQQSRVSWSGGGTGGLGAAMIIGAKSNADNQANDLFKMCMEARGYTARQVSNQDFENQKNSPLKDRISIINKERSERCNKSEYKLLQTKMACKSNENSLQQLVDKNLISEEEKPIFSKYRIESQGSNDRLLDALRLYGNEKDKEASVVMEDMIKKTEEKALDLFEGKISWGEYNKCRKESYQYFEKERVRIYSSK